MSTSNVNAVMDLFKFVLDGDVTEFDALHPFQQERARQYQSVIQEAADHLENAENYASARWLRRAQIDAVVRSDEWMDRGWTARPTVGYMFDRVELGSVPKPSLLTVPSTKSANAIVVMVCYKDVNDRGYGDLASASFYAVKPPAPTEECEQFMASLAKAVRFFYYTLPTLNENGGVRGEARLAAYDDSPDF